MLSVAVFVVFLAQSAASLRRSEGVYRREPSPTPIHLVYTKTNTQFRFSASANQGNRVKNATKNVAVVTGRGYR